MSNFREDNKDQEEEVDIDLNDPDVEKAAVKIQAGFKGFKARQEIKDLKVSERSIIRSSVIRSKVYFFLSDDMLRKCR